MTDLVKQTFYKEGIKITLSTNPDTNKVHGIKVDIPSMTKIRLLNASEIFATLAQMGEPDET